MHHVNPTCGDEVTLRVHLEGEPGHETVTDVSYDAEGCSISQAAASVMADLVIGQPVSKALETHEAFVELMHGRGKVEPDEEVLEDGIAFAGVAKFPARIKCALLSWMAFKDATATALSLEPQGGLMTDTQHTPVTTPTCPTSRKPPAAAPPRPPRTTCSRR